MGKSECYGGGSGSGYHAGMPDQPDPEPQDPRQIDHNDPTVRIMGNYLRKNAEFAARQEMERLIEEAQTQAGEPPQRDL
jgi:hypothetical protein